MNEYFWFYRYFKIQKCKFWCILTARNIYNRKYFFLQYFFIFNKVGDRNCYVLIDSNIDLSSYSLSYFDSCLSNGYNNLITRATRLTTQFSTLYDMIWVLLTDLSDHLPNFTCLNFKKPAVPTHLLYLRN